MLSPLGLAIKRYARPTNHMREINIIFQTVDKRSLSSLLRLSENKVFGLCL